MKIYVSFDDKWAKQNSDRVAAALERVAAAQEGLLATAKDIRDALAVGPAVKIELTQTLEGKEVTGMVNLTDIQKYSIRVKDELDAKGNPVASAGPFKSSLSDDTLGTLADDADGLGTTFVASGKLGAGSVTLTDSTNSLAGVSNFTIGASAPVTVELEEGAPANQ